MCGEFMLHIAMCSRYSIFLYPIFHSPCELQVVQVTRKRLVNFTVHQFLVLCQHFDIWPAEVVYTFRDNHSTAHNLCNEFLFLYCLAF